MMCGKQQVHQQCTYANDTSTSISDKDLGIVIAKMEEDAENVIKI